MIVKGRLIRPVAQGSFNEERKILRIRFDDAHEHNLSFWMEVELTEADIQLAREANGKTVDFEVQKIP